MSKKYLWLFILILTFFLGGCTFSKNKKIDTMYDRDIKTLSEIKLLQLALTLYYVDNDSYPTTIDLLSKEGAAYMRTVPIGIQGKTNICNANYHYKYTYIEKDNYSLEYCIDSPTEKISHLGVSPGMNTAVPRAIE